MKKSLFAIAVLSLVCSLALLNGCNAATDTTTTTTATTTSSVTTTTSGGTGTWSVVGVAGLTGTREIQEAPVIAFDSSDTPYITFSDADPGNYAALSVMKYNSTAGQWEMVGTRGCNTDGAVGSYSANTACLAMKGTTPYIAFRSSNLGNHISVAQWDGSQWASLGSPTGVSDSVYPALFISNNVPYVAFSHYENSSKTTAGYYNTSDTWTLIGSAGFTPARADCTSLFVESGTPYVAFRDTNLNTSVMKFDGGSWVTLGGSIENTTAWPSVAAYLGDAYVAFSDSSNSQKATVKVYSGSSWTTLGGAALSSAAAIYPALCIAGGVPYVAYGDNDLGNKVTVRKYTGGSWQTVGTAGFSAYQVVGGSERMVSIAVNSAGVPYVAIMENTGGTPAYRVTVMKYQ